MSDTGKEDRVYATIGNYYGSPYVYKEKDGKYFNGIDDYSGGCEEEISQEFYDAWIKEWGKNDGKYVCPE